MSDFTVLLMLGWGTLLLCITVLGSVAMAMWRAEADRPAAWLAMLHGFLAAAGFTLTLYVGFTAGLPPLMWIGIVTLMVAGGVRTYLNFRYQARQHALPVSTTVLHAVIALVGVSLVVFGGYGQPW